MKSFKAIIAILFLIQMNNLFAQEVVKDLPKLNYYNTQVKEFHSEIINDDFHIYISLPEDYSESDKTFPVLYVLDGDIAFGIATSIARYLQYGNNIPEMIIVGIGYGELSEENGNKRKRDYTPAQSTSSDNGGGAEPFLNFINEELITYIDANFKTDKKNRVLAGYSLGGLFALFSLFNSPETFNRYIIGSPYLTWGNYAIYEYEERAAIKYTELNANVFISVGSEESDEKYFDPIDEIVSRIQDRSYIGLQLDTKVFDGSTHLMGPPEAITYGLLSVFKW